MGIFKGIPLEDAHRGNMNHRDYKQFAPLTSHHIYNRGNGKRDIFLDADDYNFFLYRLKENLFPTLKMPIEGSVFNNSHTPYKRKTLPSGAFSLLAYCLMPNHFHLLIQQNSLLPVSKLLAKVCTSYSKYFNKKYDNIGGVFQDQFKAVLVVSDTQLLWLSAYIHQNPVIAGIIKKIEDYQWSSYLDLVGLRQGSLCDKSFFVKMVGSKNSYKKFVDESFEKIKQRKDIKNLLIE